MLHLDYSAKGNVIVGNGSDGANTVYLVRAGRAYKYQDLVDAGSRKLFASGTWMLNRDFAGNGSQYRAAKLEFNGNPAGLVDANGDPLTVTGATKAINGNNGSAVTLPDCGFAAAGYHFIGWNTAADGSGTTYNVGDSFTLDEAGSTLYAMWEADGTSTFQTLRSFGARLFSALSAGGSAKAANAANGIAALAEGDATAKPAKTEDWELVTLTQEKGEYRFYDLPAYVVVDDEVGDVTDPNAIKDNVYQPQSEWNRVDRYQKGAIAVQGPDGDVLYYMPPAGYDPYDTATPYLVGYSVRVINDDPETAEYMVSKYHVDAPGQRTSDITEFNASLNGDYNVDGNKEEAFAVVAQESKKESDIEFGTDRYEITYRGVRYDLANRLYEKLAGDAGLVLQNPVLIAGKVWEDADANGLQDAEEIGIQGAVVKLERYWYDTSGLGSLEPQPGETVPDITPDSTSLTSEQIAEIYALGGMTYPAPDGSEIEVPQDFTDGQIAAMANWIKEIQTKVEAINAKVAGNAALTEEETAYKASALNRLLTFERIYSDLADGYWRPVEGSDGNSSLEHVDADERIATPLQAAIFVASADAADIVDESEKGVWRRDWTFTQDKTFVMVEGDELSADSIDTRLTDEDAINMVGDNGDNRDEIYFDQNGAAYIPGSAFDTTVSSGDWAFLAPGTGTHKVGGTAEFKVLYGYRARIISYPNAEDYLHTIQHAGVSMVNNAGAVNTYTEDVAGIDRINSDYDYATQALRPNYDDKKLASLLSDKVQVDDSLTDLEVGDLIVVTRLADDSERSFTNGPRAKYVDINGEGLVTVTFDANGGTGAAMESLTGLLQESVIVPECTYTRNGYVFIGWNTMADGSGTTFMPGTNPSLSGRVSTVYAQWQLNPALVGTDATVSFDAGVASATGETTALDVKFGDSVTLPECGFALADHEFTGWNTSADGKGTAYAAGETLLVDSAAITLYAQWKVPVVDENNNPIARMNARAAAPAARAADKPNPPVNPDGTTDTWAPFPPAGETEAQAKARLEGYLLHLWPQGGATDEAAVNAAIAAGVDWISKASVSDLRDMSGLHRSVIFGDPVDKFDNNTGAAGADGKQDLKYDSYTDEWVRVHEGNGFDALNKAYVARMEDLNREATYRWSDVKWFDSVNHDFGLVPVARQSISGIVWQDTNYDGLQSAGESRRFANIPVTLERFWWGVKADGTTGWVADDDFNNSERAHTVSDANGFWIFEELEVAGTTGTGSKVYGYRAKVDSLPGGYGVTHINRGNNGAVDSDLNEDNKILEPGEPYDGMIDPGRPLRGQCRQCCRESEWPRRHRVDDWQGPRRRAQRHRLGALRHCGYRRHHVQRSRERWPEGQHLRAHPGPDHLPGSHGHPHARPAAGRLQRCQLCVHGPARHHRERHREQQRLDSGGQPDHRRRRQLPLRGPAHGGRQQPALHLPGARCEAGRGAVRGHQPRQQRQQRLRLDEHGGLRQCGHHLPDGRAGRLRRRAHHPQRLRPHVQPAHRLQLDSGSGPGGGSGRHRRRPWQDSAAEETVPQAGR